MKEQALLWRPLAPPGQTEPAASAKTVTFQRSELDDKINNIKRNSTDQNVASFAQMMRDLVLN